MNRYLLLLLAALPALAPALSHVDTYQAPPPALMDDAVPLANDLFAVKRLGHAKSRPQDRAFYRRHFTVPQGRVASAVIHTTWNVTLFCNGHQVKPVPEAQPDFQVKFHRFDLTQWIQPGAENLLAIRLAGGVHPASLVLRGTITMEDGTMVELVSDETFRAVEEAPSNWMKPECDDHAWPPAVVHGGVLTAPWNTVSDIFQRFTTPAERMRYQAFVEKHIAPPLPADAPDFRAELVSRDGMVAIAVNGELIAPVTYLAGGGIWNPNTDDIVAKVGAAGIPMVEYGLKTNCSFRGPGDYDFSFIDRDIRRILKLSPAVFIGVNVRIDFFSEWNTQHPAELIGYSTGIAEGGNDIGRRIAPSMASELFRKEASEYLAALLRHLQKHTWYKRIIYMRVSHGVFSEWAYYGMGNEMPDTGPAMTRRFRTYLKELYQTDDVLQKAWHRTDVTLATATVPGAAERRGKDRYVRNPADSHDKQTIDYYHCHAHVVAETILRLARTVKENAPKLLVGAYYGYILSSPYPYSEKGNAELDYVLSSPDIDFLSCPYGYEESCRAVGGDGMPRSLPSIFLRHQKLHIFEADTRTLYTGKNSLNHAKSAADNAALIKRDFANGFLRGCGVQFLQVNQRSPRAWFNGPEILTVFHQGVSFYPELYRHAPNSVASDIAVVLDHNALLEHSYPERNRQQMMKPALAEYALHALNRTGYLYDLLSPADLIAKSPRQYRAVVFLNAINQPDAPTQEWLRQFRQHGQTVVWCYAPGLVTPDGWSVPAMEHLTGIRLAVEEVRKPLAVILANGSQMNYISRKIPLAESPHVHAEDAAAVVLGHYADGNQPALVRKPLPDGSTAVFSGAPITEPAVWQEIFGHAGLHRLTADPAILIGGSRGLGVHTGTAGTITISLPVPVKSVKDLFGEPVQLLPDGKTIRLSSQSAQTWVLAFD